MLIWLWFKFGKWYLSMTRVHLNFFSFAEYKYSIYDLMILWSSSMSVGLSLFSFMHLLIWIFFLCFLAHWIMVCLFSWFFLKNQLIVSLILCIVFFISILLISALNLITFLSYHHGRVCFFLFYSSQMLCLLNNGGCFHVLYEFWCYEISS